MNRFQSSTFNIDLSENVAYNNSSFPAYVNNGLLSLYPDYSERSHWHEDLEFLVILSGTMTYNVNGQLLELTPGNGVFVNSRQLHYGFSSTRSECFYICILLHPSLLSSNQDFEIKYVEPFIRNTNCPYLYLDSSIGWQHKLITLLQDIYDKREKEMAQFLFLRHFFEMFELLYEHNRPVPVTQNTSSISLNTLKNMVLYIQEHYEDKITLADIAKAGSCCKSKCSELFKRYLKDSPIIYLNKYRLKISCDMLRSTDMSITEVALDCGFNGASYFCEIFHKYYGMTPHAYKSKS